MFVIFDDLSVYLGAACLPNLEGFQRPFVIYKALLCVVFVVLVFTRCVSVFVSASCV